MPKSVSLAAAADVLASSHPRTAQAFAAHPAVTPDALASGIFATSDPHELLSLFAALVSAMLNDPSTWGSPVCLDALSALVQDRTALPAAHAAAGLRQASGELCAALIAARPTRSTVTWLLHAVTTPAGLTRLVPWLVSLRDGALPPTTPSSDPHTLGELAYGYSLSPRLPSRRAVDELCARHEPDTAAGLVALVTVARDPDGVLAAVSSYPNAPVCDDASRIAAMLANPYLSPTQRPAALRLAAPSAVAACCSLREAEAWFRRNAAGGPPARTAAALDGLAGNEPLFHACAAEPGVLHAVASMDTPTSRRVLSRALAPYLPDDPGVFLTAMNLAAAVDAPPAEIASLAT